jgi:hypothetical protein
MNNLTKCTSIMAILQDHRVDTATLVQDVFTRHGCYIRARLGLHEGGVLECSDRGLILLQVCGDPKIAEVMNTELNDIPGVHCQYMNLEFQPAVEF